MTIEILDAADALVRRYSSADVPPAMDLKKLGTAPEWFTTPSTVSAAPGMHRFVWPLRYPAPAGLAGRRSAGGGAFADGIWAPPGSYKVVLTVNGQRFTQPLTVVPDPRISLPASAYAEQFTFAREVEQTRASLAAALTEAGALVKRKDITDVLRQKGDGNLRRDRGRRVHCPAARRIDSPFHQSGNWQNSPMPSTAPTPRRHPTPAPAGPG